MKRKSTFALFALILSVLMTQAQVGDHNTNERSIFILNAEFRNRTEISPSFDSTGNARFILVPEGTKSGITIWQRSRITLNYMNKRIETKISIQDVRPFGQNDKTWLSNNGQAVSVHEAWAKFFLIRNQHREFAVKMGRQEISNPDGRLIWYKNWNNYGAAHDALMIECHNMKRKAEWQLGFSLNSFNGYGFAQLPKYRQMAYFNFTKKFGSFLTFHITDFFTTQERPTGLNAVYGKNSVGFNPIFNLGKLTLNSSFYYQHGSIPGISGSQNVAAYIYSVNAWYKLRSVKFGVGHESYSGDANPADATSEAFRTFSCGAHLYFGNTDFHIPLLKRNKGLTDIHAKIKGDFNEKTKFYAAFHMISFQQMNNYLNDLSEEIEFKTVGNTADIVITRLISSTVNLKAGFSVMLPTEDFVNYQLGYGNISKFHGWGWLMFTIKPNFFKIEQ